MDTGWEFLAFDCCFCAHSRSRVLQALVSAMARRGTSTDEGHNENYTKDNLFRIKVRIWQTGFLRSRRLTHRALSQVVPALDASFTQTLQLATDFSAAIATSVAGTEESGDWRLPDEVRWLVGKVASQTLQLHALEDEIATLADEVSLFSSSLDLSKMSLA